MRWVVGIITGIVIMLLAFVPASNWVWGLICPEPCGGQSSDNVPLYSLFGGFVIAGIAGIIGGRFVFSVVGNRKKSEKIGLFAGLFIGLLAWHIAEPLIIQPDSEDNRIILSIFCLTPIAFIAGLFAFGMVARLLEKRSETAAQIARKDLARKDYINELKSGMEKDSS